MPNFESSFSRVSTIKQKWKNYKFRVHISVAMHGYDKALRIDPWAAEKYENYAEIMEKFGIERFDFSLPNMHRLLRRGIVFGHRDFGRIYRAINRGGRFAILTGLSPSGKMHLGHKMVIEQVIYYQGLGADVFIAVADLEAYAIRGIPLEKSEKIAREEYVANYIALGLGEKNCQVYYQSKRQEVKNLAMFMGDKVNLSEMQAIYGFSGDTSTAHLMTPMIQVGDILHVQLEKFGGPRPTLVPVGIDQDPHIRLTRDLVGRHRVYSVIKQDVGVGVFVKGEGDAKKLIELAKDVLSSAYKEFEVNLPYRALYVRDAENVEEVSEILMECEKRVNPLAFYMPSSTYHQLMTGITGGKMSSSDERSAIFLSDGPDILRKKVMNALTGGAVSAEEQRRIGGKPEKCTIYELYLYHLIEDDDELEKIYRECRGGERLCGQCKKEALQYLEEMIADIAEKRKWAMDAIDDYVRGD